MGIYKPEIGDTVEFWNDMDELWEPGTVIAYGADRRLYFIQPDDEDQPEFLIGYTGIRPVTETPKANPVHQWELDLMETRIRELEADVIHWQGLYRQMASDRDGWRMTAEGRATTREGAVSEMTRTEWDNLDTPEAVIDGVGSKWEFDPVTERYIFGNSIRSLGYIEDVYGISERIY